MSILQRMMSNAHWAALAATISLIALYLEGCSSCSQEKDRRLGSEKAGTSKLSDYVIIGVVDPQRAEHVTSLLEKNGIPVIVEGSVVYGVQVPSEQSRDAIRILERDAASLGYRFEPSDE